MEEHSRIFIAGHKGLVGSAIHRNLARAGYRGLLFRTRRQLDLRNRQQVNEFFATERPEYVFLAAAKVGGILANCNAPAEFLFDNLAVQNNVIDAACRFGTRKLLFLGSSCIYPKHAPQPIREEALLTGPLEPTNEAYAIAKIAGLKMIEAYRKQYGFSGISLMPTNLYGPNDNFDIESSHVLPALLRKFHEAAEKKAPEMVVWGSGTPRREFLHVDDLASAAVFLMRNYDGAEIVNVGTGVDLSIAELAWLIAEVVGYEGRIVFDSSKPDGTPRKLLDVSRLTGLGWRASIGLRQGIESTYRWYVDHHCSLPVGA
jgi:GDP-L-fucose synthase